MKILRSLPVVFLCLWLSGQSAAERKPTRSTSGVSADPSAANKLKAALDAVLPSPKLSGLEYGAAVVSLDQSEVIYEKNGDAKLVPASVCKVFTAYTALKRLKPTSTFKTYIYSTGPVKDGRLMGDLILKGGGDPGLVSERMWMLVNDFMRYGVKTVSGKLIADSSYFDQERNPESRPKYLKDQAYNAPVGALSFNFNTTTVFVKPADTEGAPPIVYTDPENSYVDVVNQAKTVRNGKNTLNVNRLEGTKGDLGDTVLLRGNIPMDQKEMRFYRNIVNPSLYAAHMFSIFLKQRGVTIEGRMEEGTVPPNAKLLVEFDSIPTWQIVWGLNKFSNNFVADQLLKKVGAEAWGAPGSLEKGITAMADTLEDIGIKKGEYKIEDGSGLTRKTRVTPRQIVQVLSSAYHDFSLSAEYMASLAVAGEDGTLRRRFPNSGNMPVIRAKTGTLDGVSALAGYVQTLDGERLAFAIMLNDNKNKYGALSGWADHFVTALTKFSRK